MCEIEAKEAIISSNDNKLIRLRPTLLIITNNNASQLYY